MTIISKNHHPKKQLPKISRTIIILFGLAALSGCGNKGDLYHPPQQSDSEVIQSAVADSGERHHVSL